ncbi:hypothetical protein GQ457_17G017330 [Hibiscus cannabinus]
MLIERATHCRIVGTPLKEYLKFNVDAAVKGSFRKAGIKGSLPDYNGNVLSRFSKSTGCLDPTRAELAAIMEAIKIKNPRTAPSNFMEIMSKCATLCTRCSWEVRFVFREQNVDTYLLAQAGVGRHISFIWFAPVG